MLCVASRAVWLLEKRHTYKHVAVTLPGSVPAFFAQRGGRFECITFDARERDAGGEWTGEEDEPLVEANLDAMVGTGARVDVVTAGFFPQSRGIAGVRAIFLGFSWERPRDDYPSDVQQLVKLLELNPTVRVKLETAEGFSEGAYEQHEVLRATRHLEPLVPHASRVDLSDLVIPCRGTMRSGPVIEYHHGAHPGPYGICDWVIANFQGEGLPSKFPDAYHNPFWCEPCWYEHGFSDSEDTSSSGSDASDSDDA